MEARFGTIMVALLAIGQAIAQDLRFQHLTTEDGLSDNAVTCIFEDREGYIWIGTERGLNRFDGQRVDRFMAGPEGPSGYHITSIAEDSRGDLWITTADAGLSRRHRTTRRFEHFRRDTTNVWGLPNEQLNHVLVVDDSLLVLSSRGSGAIWYHLRKGVVQRRGFGPVVVNEHGDTTSRAEDDWCHTALRLDDQRIWLPMMRSPGPHVVDAHSGELVATMGTAKALVTNAVLTDGALFMGGWAPGIYRADPERPEAVSYFPMDEEITAMVEWDDHRLLAATKVSGLVWLDKDGKIIDRCQHARSDPFSPLGDRMTCLLRDRSKNLWVGTAKGLSVYAPSVWRFNAVPLLPDERAGDLVFHSIEQGDDGTIRLSTSKGFILVDPVDHSRRMVELTHAGGHLEVTGLFRTGPDEYFLGTETGIFRYDPRHERILPETETGKWSEHRAGTMFQTRAVLPFFSDGRELLLLGALGYGHIAIDRATGENVRKWSDYRDERGTLMLRSTLRDTHGVYWSATVGGVVRWTPVAVGENVNGTVYSTRAAGKHHLPGDDAQALACRGDTVWVALRDAGLASIVSGHARAHPPPAHFPSDILGVTVDRSGQVWCTTSNGLLRYAPKTNTWLYVRVNDGGTFRQLTKCIITLHDGRIALCADDHLLLFDPAAYDALPELPSPRLVGIGNTWGSLKVDIHGGIELPFQNSAFDARLTALQPVGAAPLTFLYRLDDEGSDYRQVTASEPLRYAGVPVGEHRLLVRVRDAYGREGPEHALLTITVAGPFWQRWWFFLLVLGMGALGMLLVSRLRQRQRLKLQGVRDRIARDLHDDIGSTLGSISFYSEALKRKLGTTDDAVAQEVAGKIGTSSRDMIDQMSDIVWSVDPKNDDAGALITRLQAFAGDLLATKNITLHFNTDPSLNERKLTAEQRRNLFLICKEVLHNTLKYADAHQVTIAFNGTSRALTLELMDNGIGFDPANTDSYNGNGLPNMRSRATAIGATLTIDSAAGRGTRVRITMPLNA